MAMMSRYAGRALIALALIGSLVLLTVSEAAAQAQGGRPLVRLRRQIFRNRDRPGQGSATSQPSVPTFGFSANLSPSGGLGVPGISANVGASSSLGASAPNPNLQGPNPNFVVATPGASLNVPASDLPAPSANVNANANVPVPALEANVPRPRPSRLPAQPVQPDAEADSEDQDVPTPIGQPPRPVNPRPPGRRPSRKPKRPVSGYEGDGDTDNDGADYDCGDDFSAPDYRGIMDSATRPMRHFGTMLDDVFDKVHSHLGGVVNSNRSPLRGKPPRKAHDGDDDDSDYESESRRPSSVSVASSFSNNNGYSRTSSAVNNNGRTEGFVSETRNGRTKTRRFGSGSRGRSNEDSADNEDDADE